MKTLFSSIVETVKQAQVAPETHDLHEQPATSWGREIHSQFFLQITVSPSYSQTECILSLPIFCGHFRPRTRLCTLIAQRVLKMRRGTCRPNFADRDELRDWDGEGEQGCGEPAGVARGRLQCRGAPALCPAQTIHATLVHV